MDGSGHSGRPLSASCTRKGWPQRQLELRPGSWGRPRPSFRILWLLRRSLRASHSLQAILADNGLEPDRGVDLVALLLGRRCDVLQHDEHRRVVYLIQELLQILVITFIVCCAVQKIEVVRSFNGLFVINGIPLL